MSTEIRLAGDAASQAQLLVAELLAEGVDVRARSDSGDQDRGLEALASDFGVALVAQASYETVRYIVERWIEKRKLKKADITVTPTDDPQGAASGT